MGASTSGQQRWEHCPPLPGVRDTGAFEVEVKQLFETHHFLPALA